MTKRAKDNPPDPAQQSLADILTNLPAVRAAKKVNTLSRVHRRLIEPHHNSEEARELAFHHTVFCQTSLPYRDPGDDLRLWEREQGNITLQVEAGHIANPTTRKMMPVGLPWGTKPRLILAHLNAEALRQTSREIEVEGSLSAFVKRIRGFNGGREIRAFKDQLTRLSASNVRLALFRADRGASDQQPHRHRFELWPEKDERQRVLWPQVITLSAEYFASLQAHAVPLYEDDLAELAHSALALDIYAWLAQRLHRITPTKSAFIPFRFYENPLREFSKEQPPEKTTSVSRCRPTDSVHTNRPNSGRISLRSGAGRWN